MKTKTYGYGYRTNRGLHLRGVGLLGYVAFYKLGQSCLIGLFAFMVFTTHAVQLTWTNSMGENVNAVLWNSGGADITSYEELAPGEYFTWDGDSAEWHRFHASGITTGDIGNSLIPGDVVSNGGYFLLTGIDGPSETAFGTWGASPVPEPTALNLLGFFFAGWGLMLMFGGVGWKLRMAKRISSSYVGD